MELHLSNAFNHLNTREFYQKRPVLIRRRKNIDNFELPTKPAITPACLIKHTSYTYNFYNLLFTIDNLLNQKTGSSGKTLMRHNVTGTITNFIHSVIHRYCG